MHKTVITIVSGRPEGLTAELEKKALSAVKSLGVDALQTEYLQPKKALDILLLDQNVVLTAQLRQKLAGLEGCDIFVQPNDVFRKKKLLVADMDATIIRQETLDELARHFNLQDKIIPITEKAMRGEIDFQEALRMRVRMLKGLPLSALYDTLKKVEFSTGADVLVKTMNRAGGRCVLISGGFDIFTGHVAATLGFYKNIGNRLEIDNGALTGEVIPPIVDKTVKEQTVRQEAKALGIDMAQVMAVGDGANDIPMLKVAGVGVGYFGKPAVVEATPFQVRHTDLTSLLYMQGLKPA